MSESSFKEQRQYQRYETKDNLLFLDCGFHVGEIVNVSRGGVFCRCINGKNIGDPPSRINLFSSAMNFHIQTFVKTITKKQEPCKILDCLSQNLCHLRFDRENKEVFAQLGRFICSTSERKESEKLPEKAQEETEGLQNSPNVFNAMSGILPICCQCKKIRNDEGDYEQIESYIHKHTGVDFSHTICPVCMKNHYPDYFENDENFQKDK